jgi:predicted dithiol-disulfide oxidoreductase (DUF899 family)
MTSTTPTNPTNPTAARPPIVDLATWQAARDELLVEEKAHTRRADALAAKRRRLPMVEVDGQTEVLGKEGSVPFISLFQGREELLVYKHMFHTGRPIEQQCEGCTVSAWHLREASPYLNARGVSLAFLCEGPWDEVEPFVEFMGYTEPWYSVAGVAEPAIAGEMGNMVCFLRDGDRVFLTYRTTGRGNEPFAPVFGLLDLTPYGRGESWQDTPEGWPEGNRPCWYWRCDENLVPTFGPTGRPAPQWTRPGATPTMTGGPAWDQ